MTVKRGATGDIKRQLELFETKNVATEATTTKKSDSKEHKNTVAYRKHPEKRPYREVKRNIEDMYLMSAKDIRNGLSVIAYVKLENRDKRGMFSLELPTSDRTIIIVLSNFANYGVVYTDGDTI